MKALDSILSSQHISQLLSKIQELQTKNLLYLLPSLDLQTSEVRKGHTIFAKKYKFPLCTKPSEQTEYILPISRFYHKAVLLRTCRNTTEFTGNLGCVSLFYKTLSPGASDFFKVLKQPSSYQNVQETALRKSRAGVEQDEGSREKEGSAPEASTGPRMEWGGTGR